MGEIILEEDPATLQLGIVTDMDNNKYIETANQILMLYKEYQENVSRTTTLRNWMRKKFLQRKKTTRNEKSAKSKTFLI